MPWLRRLAGDVQIDFSPAAAEGLFLARPAAHRRMAVLRTSLARQHGQLFGADPVGVDVHQNAKAGLFEFVQAEVGDLDAFMLRGGNKNAGLAEQVMAMLLAAVKLFTGEHGNLLGGERRTYLVCNFSGWRDRYSN